MNNSTVQNVKLRYGIVGNCEALNRAIEIALKIAPVDLSVLVVGENGVGKESFPRIIHDHSLRKNKKYFAVNCGAIPEGTIDSELFGHEKGAFTGAVEQREGYFAAANGGTLFLDEVVNYLCKRKQDCCVCSKQANTSVWGRAKCAKLMCALWRLPMLTWKRLLRRVNLEKTCFTA